MPEPPTACGIWRIKWPFGALTNKGYVADWVTASSPALQAMLDSERYTHIVTPRFVFEDPYKFARRLHAHGQTWVWECDDDLLSPESVARQMTATPGDRAMAEAIEANRQLGLQTLQLANIITVASEPLADTVRAYTSTPVIVVPNALNLEIFRANLSGIPHSEPPLMVGWAGARRDDADLEMLIQAWPVLARLHPEIRFVVIGYRCEALLDCVPAEQIAYWPGVAFEEYPVLLNSLDIACCCVDDSRWNANKSGVKWMEASIAGAACVVSQNLYGRYVQNGHTALVAHTVEQWVEALHHLIEKPELRRSLVRHAQKVIVAESTLRTNWWRWPAAYRTDQASLKT